MGYCLDYEEHYRDMMHLCVINDEGIARFRALSKSGMTSTDAATSGQEQNST